MKAKIYGFEWNAGKGITYTDLLQHLGGISGKEVDNRVLAVTQMGDTWAGVFLTVKDNKTFVQMKHQGGGFVITAEQFEKGTNPVEVNFFIIKEATGRGLYLHYFHSATVNAFCAFCHERYDELVETKVKEEVEKTAADTEAAKKKIRKKFDGKLTYQMIFRKEGLKKYVSELQRVKHIEFQFATFDMKEPEFQPLSKTAKRISHKVCFDKKTAAESVNAVVGFLNVALNKLRKSTVVGVDPLQHEVTYRLLNDPNSFREYDYDQLIGTVRLDSTDLIKTLKDSQIIAELIKVSQDGPINAILTTPAK